MAVYTETDQEHFRKLRDSMSTVYDLGRLYLKGGGNFEMEFTSEPILKNFSVGDAEELKNLTKVWKDSLEEEEEEEYCVIVEAERSATPSNGGRGPLCTTP